MIEHCVFCVGDNLEQVLCTECAAGGFAVCVCVCVCVCVGGCVYVCVVGRGKKRLLF
jgi:hypothetical protein